VLSGVSLRNALLAKAIRGHAGGAEGAGVLGGGGDGDGVFEFGG